MNICLLENTISEELIFPHWLYNKLTLMQLDWEPDLSALMNPLFSSLFLSPVSWPIMFVKVQLHCRNMSPTWELKQTIGIRLKHNQVPFVSQQLIISSSKATSEGDSSIIAFHFASFKDLGWYGRRWDSGFRSLFWDEFLYTMQFRAFRVTFWGAASHGDCFSLCFSFSTFFFLFFSFFLLSFFFSFIE